MLLYEHISHDSHSGQQARAIRGSTHGSASADRGMAAPIMAAPRHAHLASALSLGDGHVLSLLSSLQVIKEDMGHLTRYAQSFEKTSRPVSPSLQPTQPDLIPTPQGGWQAAGAHQVGKLALLPARASKSPLFSSLVLRLWVVRTLTAARRPLCRSTG